jgi:hypothetical protein
MRPASSPKVVGIPTNPYFCLRRRNNDDAAREPLFMEKSSSDAEYARLSDMGSKAVDGSERSHNPKV